MALSVAQGFSTFLDGLVPLPSQRTAAARHRASVEKSIRNALPVTLFRETGSFAHGTGVRNHTDVDLLVSISRARPESSDTALSWVRTALRESFPNTIVRTSRPAVVVEFDHGNETWEVIPGFITSRGPKDISVYDIPGPSTGWIDSAPTAHLDYVSEVNAEPKISGGAKKLARLAKAWKYYNDVPISSFYLEMRAAKYLSGDSLFDPMVDMCLYLESLEEISLASMNDPKRASGRFDACSTAPKIEETLSKLSTAATRVRKALDASNRGDAESAFHYLGLLFGGNFPAR
ncbi:nucleotidyltransferase [Streptomyces pathocidini]|uniref:Nucleotidyltransferase n=1 Tax=Streptomyces pathocidini TaxID=1650571 RepID=A0ABW7UWG0_9ACTN|nr:nucleotidyltransferase [Streptomyces pathocidini]